MKYASFAVCDTCGHVVHTRQGLMAHNRVKHQHSDMTCNQCTQYFSSKTAYKSHMLQHADVGLFYIQYIIL